MSQRLVEISQFHIQQEAFIPLTRQLLFQQGDVNYQIYKNSQKFKLEIKYTSEMSLIQKLYTSNCSIWLSALVLQLRSSIIPFENTKKNAKKGHFMNSRGIQNFPYVQYQSYHGSYLYQSSFSEAQ